MRLLASQEIRMNDCQNKGYQKVWNFFFSICIEWNETLNTHAYKLPVTVMISRFIQDCKVYKAGVTLNELQAA